MGSQILPAGSASSGTRRKSRQPAIQTRPPRPDQPLCLKQPLDCFAMLAMTLGFYPSLRGGRRPTKQSMGSHWCLLRRCACSGRPGLLRDARNDGVFMCHCEEGADRRGNPELATGVCFAAAPLAASGLLRCTRNDVEFSRHCEEGEDRRGNPDSATGLYHAAVPVAGAHGLLPATATASASTPTTSPTRPRKSAATRK